MVQVECNPRFTNHKLHDFCVSRGIQMVAYSSFGSPDLPWGRTDLPHVLADPVIKEIADKHGKSTAQVSTFHLIRPLKFLNARSHGFLFNVWKWRNSLWLTSCNPRNIDGVTMASGEANRSHSQEHHQKGAGGKSPGWLVVEGRIIYSSGSSCAVESAMSVSISIPRFSILNWAKKKWRRLTASTR